MVRTPFDIPASRAWPALLAAVALAAVALAAASPARAQEERRLRWSADWSRVHPAAYGAAGVAVGGALLFDYLLDPGPEALVRGPEAFDATWRERLMAPREEDRERAAALSDVLLGALLAWPLVDSIFVAGVADENTDVFWQLISIAMEAYAADLLIATIAKQLVARERPHGARCTLEDRLESPGRCGPGGRLRSFYSGHSSAAFNAAGVVCVTHAHLPIYGSEAADWLACGVALLTASTVATLRVIADRHYASDVIVGSVVGLLTGLVMPLLLHFQWDPDGASSDAAARAAPLRSAPTFALGGSF